MYTHFIPNMEHQKLNILDPVSSLGMQSASTLRVQKRGARGFEDVKFDKITERIAKLCDGLNVAVNPVQVAQKTIKGLHDGIRTEELDKLSVHNAESMKFIHPDYSVLAARIMVSNLHKTTSNSFSECSALARSLIETTSKVHYDFIAENAAELDAMINHQADYQYDYFGLATLDASYLLSYDEPVLDKSGNKIFTDHDGNIIPPEEIKFTRGGGAVTMREEVDRVVLKNGEAIVTTSLQPIPLKVMIARRTVDRPQYMLMRIAIACHKDSPNALTRIKEQYDMLSNMDYTHATPTMFNACAANQQLGSCFLLGVHDSIEGIMNAISNVSLISKGAGGVGIWQHYIRSQNSLIKGTGGKSSGLVKQLKIYNEAARCWDQGGKRLGAFAMYIEPWHGDILRFLRMKLSNGADTELARDLFYALWIPDLFMRRIINRKRISLFSAHTAPGLADVYDGMDVCKICNYCANPNYAKYIAPVIETEAHEHEFEMRDVFTQLYTQYENDGVAVGNVPAHDIVTAICGMQRESGTPYICFKDHVNRMSNQKNIDTVRSSNLCTEIMEVSTPDSYASCTLASVNLRKFLIKVDGKYCIDHPRLHKVVRAITRNLNRVIDVNNYAVKECIENAHGYRPIGIGIQALADVFCIMRIPFLSAEAERIDIEIAETMYHAAVTESAELAMQYGSHEKFEGSPMSRGILHQDMWKQNQKQINGPFAELNIESGRYDWDKIRVMVQKCGQRNSLLLANMPTVSTSQALGNNESFEPFSANAYVKTTLAGKFTVQNKAMVQHLIELNLWTETIRNQITNDGGSIANVPQIPADIKEIYKTVWELKQTELMRRAAKRGAFIDQSQSLNIYPPNNSDAVLRGILITAWELGLKTGSYYIRTRPATQAIKVNLSAIKSAPARTFTQLNEASAKKNDNDDCVMCSS